MTAREKRNTPLRKTSITPSQISSPVSCSGPACNRLPALLTSTSTRSNVASVACTARWTSASSVTLPGTASAWLPAAVIVSTISPSISLRRPVIVTLAPSRANVVAMAAPMPLPPPVTMATLSASRMELSCSGLNRRVRGCWRLRRSGGLMNRQACGDRPMDRCQDAELQASPNDDPAQSLDLETPPVFEVSGHRRSPLRGQRRGLLDGAIHRICRERHSFSQTDGGDLLAGGPDQRAALEAREERANARARERRHTPDAGNEEELLPQHAIDVGRDLVRNAALLECAGDPLDPLGQGPAELAEDDVAFAAGAKDQPGAGELERDVDHADEHRPGANDGADRLDVLDTVLEGDHRRVPGHQRDQRLSRGLRVVRLHAEDDEIDGSHGLRVGDRRDAHHGLALRGSHREAASLHGLQVRATRDERDVVPRFREKRAVISADPARSEHGDSHARRPARSRGPAPPPSV